MNPVYKLLLALSCFSALSAMIDDDLIEAARTGDLTEVTQFINQKPGLVLGINGNEALQQAAANGHIEIVKLILDHIINFLSDSAFPLDIEFYGFMYAVNHNYQEVVQLLLKNNIGNDTINYALAHAAEYGHINAEIIALLKSYQATP